MHPRDERSNDTQCATGVTIPGTRAPDVRATNTTPRGATLDNPLTKLLRREWLLLAWLLLLSTPKASAATSCTPIHRPIASTPASSTPAATRAPSAHPTTSTTPATSTAATTASTPATTTTTTSPATTPASATPTTLTPLALAAAAPPTRSRRSTDFLGTKEVNSSSRGNRGREKGG
ncbi:unnamed protein product [Closterium sp. NIES-53]